MHLLAAQLPAVQLKVLLDPLLAHALGDDAPALLDAPGEQHLLRGLALLLRHLQQGGVAVQRAVGAAEAAVARAVDALLRAVLHQLRRRAVGVQLDLVDGGHDLAGGVGEQLLQVADAEVRHPDVAHPARRRQLLQLLPRLDEVPVGEVLLRVGRVGGRRPVHEVQVHVVGAQVFQ